MKWWVAGSIALLLLVIVLVALPGTARADALNLRGPPPPLPSNPKLKGPPVPSLEQQFLQANKVPGAQYTDKYNNFTDKIASKAPGGAVGKAAASFLVNPIHANEQVAKKVWKAIF